MAKKSPRKRPASRTTNRPPAQKARKSDTFFSKNRRALLILGILVGGLAIIFAYFSPVIGGETLQQGDIQQYAGMSAEVRAYQEANDEPAFWTNSMFGGMPTVHLGQEFSGNKIKWIHKLWFGFFPTPVSFIFLMFVGFFVLSQALKLDLGVGAVGALAFAFSSYFIIIMEAGHTSKAAAVGYMPLVLAGVIWTYRGKYLLGGALTALFLALELTANHYQVSYYLAITLAVVGIAYLVDAIRKQMVPRWAVASGVLLLAAGLGILPIVSHVTSNQQYVKETMRGAPELSPEPGETQSSGLDLEYAYRWSYGVDETLTLLIPNYQGGASATEVDRDSEAYRQLRTERLPTYWGDQPFTSGPVYVGALVIFLFVLGIFLVDGPLKWALVVATIISIVLSWGKNFLVVNEFLFHYLPLYNKFRAPAIVLVIAELTIPLLGVLALQRILDSQNQDRAKLTRQVWIAAALTGGLSLLLWLVGPILLDFSGVPDYDETGKLRYQQQVLSILQDLRTSMFRADALRSFLFIGLGAAAIWGYLIGRLKAAPLLGIVGVLILADLWFVNKRYVNNDDFSARQAYAAPAPSPASQAILQDTEPGYRVVNFNNGSIGTTFNSANTAFFHHDVGGYHPAKLRRYQDMIDRHITPEMIDFLSAARETGDLQTMQQQMQNLDVLNMLNTRYFIISDDRAPLRNPYAYGPAWFVENVRMVPDADAEIAALNEISPRSTAVVDERFSDQLAGLSLSPDPTASVELVSWSPNEVRYQTQASREGLVVFSEIFYRGNEDWRSTIDGDDALHMRANYILRAIRVPSGTHEIVFRMEPEGFYTSETFALISSIVLYLLVIGVIVLSVLRNRKSEDPATEV